jgi:hypothetical protein
VVPFLEELSIQNNIVKGGKAVRFKLGEYRMRLEGMTGGRYTLTIWSKTRSTEQALNDFMNSQELFSSRSEDSDRRARIPMSTLDVIFQSIKHL